MNPKISVVTPSYNHAEFLEATIRSVLDQDYPNLEYIVIDGGSTDGTQEILDWYRDQVSYMVSEPDSGQTDALIKGFSRATGEIFAWLNSDDLYEPGTLHQVAEHFGRNPEDQFIYGDMTWVDRGGLIVRRQKEIPFNRFIWLYDFNYIPQPSAFWRRELYERSGGLDQSFDLSMDMDLWDRFSQLTTPRHVGQNWSRMRKYPEQKNQAFRTRSDTEDEVIRQRSGIRTSGLRYRGTRVVAKGMRVAWRLSTGCYWG